MFKPARAVNVPYSPYNAVAAAHGLEADIFARAQSVDDDAAYPIDDIAALAGAGLLRACLPSEYGGIGLGNDAGTSSILRETLTTIGRASLTVGRLFEGHVNAVRLVTHNNPLALPLLGDEVAESRMSGVWNAERGEGVTARRISAGWQLSGQKAHCSGGGSIRRPIVTARVGAVGPLMMMPEIEPDRVDLSVWQASGMRGTATGTVDFSNVVVSDAEVIGAPGDYYKSPSFSGGAWRVIAVQLGGLDRIMALHAARLNRRTSVDPVTLARFAHGAAAHEAARLLVREAADRAESDGEPGEIDAYVDLARGAFEEFALTCIEATRRNIGLSSFIKPDPLDRVIRDLETYLRQPFLDASRNNSATWLLAHGGQFG